LTIKSTAIDLIEKSEIFMDILDRQFTGCANKYGFNEDSEWTDVIVSYVPKWVEGTILKYLGRLKIDWRERDWIKVATYCFILWIKYGLHSELEMRDSHNTHCTTVAEKAKYWPEFMDLMQRKITAVSMKTQNLGGKDWTKYDLRRMASNVALIDQLTDGIIETMELAKASTGVWDDKAARSDLLVDSAVLCLLSWAQDGFYAKTKHDEDLEAEKVDVEDNSCSSGTCDIGNPTLTAGDIKPNIFQ